MHQISYAMRFTGQAIPAGPNGAVLHASTSSPSTNMTSRVGPDGLSGTIEAIAGEEATFTSEVTFTAEHEFLETGAMTFGAGNTLHFSTVGSGYLAPSVDPDRQHGVVMWRIDRGEGQFAGATGLITSNFFVDGQLRVTDHHCGVILLP